MEKLKKFGGAFVILLLLAGPTAVAAVAILADKDWALWPLAAYFITIPAVYALVD